MQIVVVLPQGEAPLKRYVEEAGLPFLLHADASRDVARAFGVWHPLSPTGWNTARPAAFAIDRAMTVREVYVGARQREFPSIDELERAFDGMR